MKKDSQKFKGLFRIASSRLFNFDYGSRGVYFITICTERRDHYFGEVMNGNVKYSALGNIAVSCWKIIPEYFPFVSLGEWIVMPNHLHGILVLGNRDARRDRIRRDAINGVSTFADAASGGVTGKCNPMINKTISTIIRWYKGRVTHEIRRTAPYFSWQSRFHDRIVRDDEEFQKISLYIKNNPRNWEIDRLFTEFVRGFVRGNDLMNNAPI